MAYPTPPVLDPIAGTATPNLTAGGPYDEVLNKIEAYLAQLGAYVDAQIAQVRGEIPSTTDFATAEQLEEVSQSASAAASAAATAQETAEAAQSTATAAQGAASTAQGTADEANASVATLEGIVSDVSGKVGKMLNVFVNVPTHTIGNAVSTQGRTVFDADISKSPAISALATVISNLMLATPNDDTSALLGYLGDNTADLSIGVPARRSSAALTAAYESGGITKASNDPVFTAADLATMRVSTEGVPYREE